jgi:hypothetical protein
VLSRIRKDFYDAQREDDDPEMVQRQEERGDNFLSVNRFITYATVNSGLRIFRIPKDLYGIYALTLLPDSASDACAEGMSHRVGFF